MMNIHVGRAKANIGGWHHKDHYGEYNDVESAYAFGYSMNSPIGSDYAVDSLGLQLNLAGVLSINAF